MTDPRTTFIGICMIATVIGSFVLVGLGKVTFEAAMTGASALCITLAGLGFLASKDSNNKTTP